MQTNNVIRLEPPVTPSQRTGVVSRADGERSWSVDTDAGAVTCRRSHSCLVEPEVGDFVLIATGTGRGGFVLAVLEREPGASTTLRTDGDARFEVPGGRLSLSARDAVEVAAPELSFLGRIVRAEAQRLDAVLGHVDAVLERVSQRVKRSYRFVEEIDAVRAEQIDYRAAQNLSARGKNTLLTAEDLVKVDGAQIHVG